MNEQWRPPSIPKGWTATYRSFHGYWELNCPHGIGHPDPRDPNLGTDKYSGIHGCDGCCSEFKEFSINPINTNEK